MKYSPECVAAFEAWAAVHEPEHKLEPRTVSPEVAPYECWTANRIFFAFAANWERVRELEEMLAAVTERADRLMGTGKGAVGFSMFIEAARKLLEKGND